MLSENIIITMYRIITLPVLPCGYENLSLTLRENIDVCYWRIGG
jgi:hypothetical protein